MCVFAIKLNQQHNNKSYSGQSSASLAKNERYNGTTKLNLATCKTPDKRFDHIHLDLIKLPKVEDFDHCLTINDRYIHVDQRLYQYVT